MLFLLSIDLNFSRQDEFTVLQLLVFLRRYYVLVVSYKRSLVGLSCQHGIMDVQAGISHGLINQSSNNQESGEPNSYYHCMDRWIGAHN
jgi:hypothetical protein